MDVAALSADNWPESSQDDHSIFSVICGSNLPLSNPLLFVRSITVTVDANAHLDLFRRVGHLGWLDAQAVPVSEEKDTLALALSLGRWLDPLAPTSAQVHGLEETNGTILDIAAVVPAHNWLDGLGSLVGVVEWNGRDVVVEDVGFDDAV